LPGAPSILLQVILLSGPHAIYPLCFEGFLSLTNILKSHKIHVH
jgi:hypothetical protein